MNGHSTIALNDLIAEFLERLIAKITGIEREQGEVLDEVFRSETLKKWTKIVRGTSVYCFIARADFETKELGQVKYGDIHFPHSWKAPAKHARGSIFADDFGLSCCERFGVKYLR